MLCHQTYFGDAPGCIRPPVVYLPGVAVCDVEVIAVEDIDIEFLVAPILRYGSITPTNSARD